MKAPIKREPVSRPDQQVDERNRPGKKNENFEEVRDRTTPERVSAEIEKRRLENEAEADRGKVKAGRAIIAPLIATTVRTMARKKQRVEMISSPRSIGPEGKRQRQLGNLPSTVAKRRSSCFLIRPT